MKFVLNRDVSNKVETVVNVNGNTIELYDYILAERWYEDQAGVTANEFIDALNTMKGDITVRINSRGGEVGNALTIYQRLLEHDGEVHCIVDGYAYSCASWILLAGDKRTINMGGMVMVHNPQMFAPISREEDFDVVRNQWTAHRDAIRSIITNRTGLKDEDVKDMMDKETFMTANQAIEKGFCSGIQETIKPFSSSVRNAMPVEVMNIFPEDCSDIYTRALQARAKALK